jgi:hypothetical protein
MNVRTPDQDRPAGAIACFASSGFEFLQPNLAFNQDVLDAFFYPEKAVPGASLPDDGSPGYVWTLGEATTRARLMYQSRYPGDSQTRQAARRFVLLGDRRCRRTSQPGAAREGRRRPRREPRRPVLR